MNELMISTRTDKTPIEVLLQVGEDERVSARDTYSFLSPGQSNDFARWARSNIAENDFAELGADFTVSRINAEYGNPLTGGVSKRELEDYRLSIPFAKKLCMLSRTERGEQARDYFIKVERSLKTVMQNLPHLSQNEIILQIAQANVQLEKELGEVREEVRQIGGKFDRAMETLAAPGGDWISSMNAKIRAIAPGDMENKRIRGKMYAELESVASVSLSVRQTRMKARMKKQGATYRERQAVTKLDVVSKDKQLRPIFEGVVKKYQALHSMRG